jgi:hypothetical protein
MNFPESDLQIRGLTEKDRQDLAFVVKHADVINVSFVNTAQDVRDLIDELEKLVPEDGKRAYPGIILKIETQSGYNHLTDILLEAMRIFPIGVMIARGDLAVEAGWENIGRVQEEILSLCQAAHVTDIWATQVLENLAKKGIPSRAEITDAAMALFKWPSNYWIPFSKTWNLTGIRTRPCIQSSPKRIISGSPKARRNPKANISYPIFSIFDLPEKIESRKWRSASYPITSTASAPP